MSNCWGSYASGLGSHLCVSVPPLGWPEFSNSPKLRTAQPAHRDTLEILADWAGAEVGDSGDQKPGLPQAQLLSSPVILVRASDPPRTVSWV